MTRSPEKFPLQLHLTTRVQPGKDFWAILIVIALLFPASIYSLYALIQLQYLYLIFPLAQVFLIWKIKQQYLQRKDFQAMVELQSLGPDCQGTLIFLGKPTGFKNIALQLIYQRSWGSGSEEAIERLYESKTEISPDIPETGKVARFSFAELPSLVGGNWGLVLTCDRMTAHAQIMELDLLK